MVLKRFIQPWVVGTTEGEGGYYLLPAWGKEYMGYYEALEAAGANVLEFERFGDYQGSWWAKVVYNSNTFWVKGSYGSCSGCDAFQAEFDYHDCERCKEHRYTWNDEITNNCEDCKNALKVYNQHLAEFGMGYLVGGEHTQEEAEKSAAEYDWSDDKEALAFIKSHVI